jgi:hypothetical protein
MAYSATIALRDNPETARAGNKWSKEEDDQLLLEIKDNTIQDIALLHKRTICAIKANLIKIAKVLFKNNVPIEDIKSQLKLNDGDIHKITDVPFAKKSKNDEQRVPDNLCVLDMSQFVSTVLKQMNELQNSINRIEKKLDDLCVVSVED